MGLIYFLEMGYYSSIGLLIKWASKKPYVVE